MIPDQSFHEVIVTGTIRDMMIFGHRFIEDVLCRFSSTTSGETFKKMAMDSKWYVVGSSHAVLYQLVNDVDEGGSTLFKRLYVSIYRLNLRGRGKMVM